MNAFHRRRSRPLAQACLLTVGSFLLSIGTTTAQQALTVERVQELVQFAGQRYGVKGLAVAVVQDGKVLAEVAYGEASTGTAIICRLAGTFVVFDACEGRRRCFWNSISASGTTASLLLGRRTDRLAILLCRWSQFLAQ